MALKRSLYFLFIMSSFSASAQGFLRTDGSRIINNRGEVILRGMGLGGWMLQEPYMLRLSGAATAQFDIRRKISGLIGEKNTIRFYDEWLANHCTKGDIDSLAAWGFNSVRLPMHYNLFTPPAEQEPVAGRITWISKGFELTDSLLAWCKANRIYLILDLHAAPGGQGNDNAIADRDPSKPSLWEDESNKQKTIALWEKLAGRYKDEEWIGGYDLINEPNWGFENATDKNGCAEKSNAPLKKLLQDITAAIRKIDTKHIIYIEGNCWGNNYEGIFPLWDNNVVVSFHKYWNFTDDASIQKFLDYRRQYNVPVWAGETGENSNAWFTNAITLFERNKIGWCMWPLKKSGINNPLQVTLDSNTKKVFDHWEGKAPKPDAGDAYNALISFAKNTHIAKNEVRSDVIDAMIRQISSSETIPFRNSNITPGKMVYAVDYDLGRSGVAYHDVDSAEYWVATQKRTPWNSGFQYRNDGVDIEVCKDTTTNGFNVGWIQGGEWLQYSLYFQEDGEYEIDLRTASKDSIGKVKLILNDISIAEVILPATGDNQLWKTNTSKGVRIMKGWNQLRLQAVTGGFNLNYLRFNLSTGTNSKIERHD